MCKFLYHFYPRSPCGERLCKINTRGSEKIFLSTLSLRRATWVLRKVPILGIFLSTLSLRRATLVQIIMSGYARDFYPRSPCGERQEILCILYWEVIISIHALLAESDLVNGGALSSYFAISIHALLAESDSRLPINNSITLQFLSTLSLRRATLGRVEVV